MSQTLTSTFGVDGLTCGNCVQHVTDEITALPGVKNVTVELVKGGTSQVTVVSDAPLSDDAIREAVDEAGYVLAPKGSLL
ncbi:heavy metal-associated domain-containing protein [Cellulomonas cellasea]|uniref:heavy-metal-associated domain-containing protein n=1 Tax=Cellulomonas cellasea TaxID=43670 RepID=UPI0025A325B2|nr:heavy metal-associated domain-containing protein [Cellulomonas cellasea]MDM8086479.1 heavy metal-associated domain-containing protein [Cellulomonas cellasea]